MRVYELSKNSWHYKLAKFYEEGGVSSDFCNYFWEVVLGFGKVCAIAFAIAFFALPLLVCPTAFVLHGVLPWEVAGNVTTGNGTHILSVLFLIEVGLAAVVALFYCGVKLDQWQKDRQAARWSAMREQPENLEFYRKNHYWPWQESLPKEPGFLKLWYKTVKEKTCVKLVFK